MNYGVSKKDYFSTDVPIIFLHCIQDKLREVLNGDIIKKDEIEFHKKVKEFNEFEAGNP